MKNNVSGNAYDVIIVGAGASGLFAAWRLLLNNPTLRILFLEKLGRVGGRLQTTTVPITGLDGNTYSVKDEEGGMRFNKTMPYVNKLIGDLQLSSSIVPFAMKVDGTQQRYYFRGTPFRSSDEPQIWSTLYKLAPGETNLNPGDILGQVMNAILQQNPGFKFSGDGGVPATAAEWQTFRNQCQYNNIVLNQWGFWALLRTYGLSEECVDLITHGIGFMGPTQAFINAGESLQIIFDFPNDPHYFTLAAGYDSITTALADNIGKVCDVQFNFGETVTAVTAASSGSGVNVFTNKLVGGCYTAPQLILAVPHAALTPIIDCSPPLQGNGAFRQAVDSVQDMVLAKIGLYFNQRWWHGGAIGLSAGPSFTDLPLGSVYCFQQYPNDPAADLAYQGPAALTIYTDFDHGSFWCEMQNLGGPYQGQIAPPANTVGASAALVAEAMRQIQLLLNVPAGFNVPQPQLATFRVWGFGDYSHGYHQYRLNVNDVTDVDPMIWNPAPNIYVCNEAWSPEQGWVEGSLIATDHVLTQGFGLSPYVRASAATTSAPASKPGPRLKTGAMPATQTA